jgi:hypothetical protein
VVLTAGVNAVKPVVASNAYGLANASSNENEGLLAIFNAGIYSIIGFAVIVELTIEPSSESRYAANLD